MVIFDTNILIEIYRGNPEVKKAIEGLETGVIYISSITAAEFLVGARDKADLIKLEKQLSHYTLIPITANICEVFLDLFKTFSLSHRPNIADTLIAATTLYYQLALYTLNKKHFRFIPGVNFY